MVSFTAAQRREMEAALRRGETPVCPACGGALDRREVRPEGVAYVRRRVWLLCPACRMSGAVDLPPDR